MPVILWFGAVGILIRMLLLGPNQCQEGKPKFQIIMVGARVLNIIPERRVTRAQDERFVRTSH